MASFFFQYFLFIFMTLQVSIGINLFSSRVVLLIKEVMMILSRKEPTSCRWCKSIIMTLLMTSYALIIRIHLSLALIATVRTRNLFILFWTSIFSLYITWGRTTARWCLQMILNFYRHNPVKRKIVCGSKLYKYCNCIRLTKYF